MSLLALYSLSDEDMPIDGWDPNALSGPPPDAGCIVDLQSDCCHVYGLHVRARSSQGSFACRFNHGAELFS